MCLELSGMFFFSYIFYYYTNKYLSIEYVMNGDSEKGRRKESGQGFEMLNEKEWHQGLEMTRTGI